MNIEYKKDNDGELITMCPFTNDIKGNQIMVGSVSCKWCKHYKGQLDFDKIVKCAWRKNNV